MHGRALRTVKWGRSAAALLWLCSLGACAAANTGRKETAKPAVAAEYLEPDGSPHLVAAGSETCGIRGSGALHCWGRDGAQAPSGSFRRVAIGGWHGCAIRTEEPRRGEVDCWGRDDAGQTSAPKGVFRELAAGNTHTCGLRPDGGVECWGLNNYGQTRSPAGRFERIQAGKNHTCAMTDDGAIECWGADDLDQLDAPAGRFVTFAIGHNHGCAIDDEGVLDCWGDNGAKQLNPPEGKYLSVAAGLEHTCAIAKDHRLVCWGGNTDGQCDAPDGEYWAVVAGSVHSCGIRLHSGRVECWGNDYFGESSPPSEYSQVSLPSADGTPTVSGKQQAEPDGGDDKGAVASAKRKGAPKAEAGSKREKDTKGGSPAAGDTDMSFDLDETEAAEAPAEDERSEGELAREKRRKKASKPAKLDDFLK